MKQEIPWYKTAVFYQLHVKCFCDSNSDGIGDFKGLKTKLDYIQSLGCTAIWLQPFYPSPLKDDGYDIANYTTIHPDYGTLADFKEFLKEAKKRNLKVVTELVINHTSDQHSWFQRARKSPPGSIHHEYYMWSDTPEKYPEARIIFKDFETSNWAWDPVAKRYYWHRFYSHQPDLNYDSPHVHKEIFRIVDFWMGLGIDGMRLDAVPYLYAREGTDCENLPETHFFLKKLRHYVDERYPNRMLLAEANQWPEDAHKYFGDGEECHMAFHFPVMPRLFMALKMEECHPIIDIMNQTPQPPEKSQWAIFLRNHDELTLEMVTDEERDYMWRVYANDPKARINLGIRRRLAPLLDNDRSKIELMNILLYSLPGSPILYYGDEIGMGDNYYLGDRNGVRTPMQWNNDRNAGFSGANPQMLYLPLIIDPEYHHEHLNVENQVKTTSSLLWWMRAAIAIRQQSVALGMGALAFLHSANPKVLALIREYEEETVLVIVNFSRYAQQITLNLKNYRGRVPVDLFSKNRFDAIAEEFYTITLGRYGYYWLKLEKSLEGSGNLLEQDLPKLSYRKKWTELFVGDKVCALLNSAIKPHLLRSRWYRSKGRDIHSLSISDIIDISAGKLLFLTVHFNDGLTETYILPLILTESKELPEKRPQAVVAEAVGPESSSYLMDALHDEVFRKELFFIAAKNKKVKGQKGFIKGDAEGLLREREQDASRLLSAEQTNAALVFDEKYLLKVYRQIDEGANVEVEILRYLTEDAGCSFVPQYRGEISYCLGKNQRGTVAVVQEYVENSGDLWNVTLDAVRRYFEEALSNESHVLTDIWYLGLIKRLGTKTAELHLAMEEAREDTLKPEPFTIHYQKAVYQGMRNQLQRNFSLLQKLMPTLTNDVQQLGIRAKEKTGEIIELFDKFMETRFAISKIRIHGDFHLGQVLHKSDELLFVDFEGEPQIPLSQRRLKRVALQDAAGMIRSFHYALEMVVKTYPDPVKEQLAPFGGSWLKEVATTFIHTYLEHLEHAKTRLIPSDDYKKGLMLKTLMVQKAVYELGYELQNRPDWVDIPLKGILHLMEKRDGDEAEQLVNR